MFYMYTIRDTVRIPAKSISEDIKNAALEHLKAEYEGFVDEDMGVIIAVTDVKDVGDASLVWGDSGVYVDVVFEVLTYYPQIQEVVDGFVTDVTDFGLFVRIGPVDGLVHVSQIMDDFVRYDGSIPAFVGRDQKKTVKMGDRVRARIVTVSLKETVTDTKIALTMRQPGLGKLEWIKEDSEKEEAENEKA